MEFETRVPFWAKLIGWLRRCHWERKDRAEKLRVQRTPVYMGSIIGKTDYVDAGYKAETHRWDCYETPLGERSVKFIRMGGYGQDKGGVGHPLHAMTITPWLEHQWECDWAKTRQEGCQPWGYVPKKVK